MTKIIVRPREVRIWIRPDGGVEWKGRQVSPADMAIMGLVLQQGAVNEMGGVQLQKNGERKMSANVLPAVLKWTQALPHREPATANNPTVRVRLPKFHKTYELGIKEGIRQHYFKHHKVGDD